MRLEGRVKLLRIHFGEDDRCGGKPLYEAIVEKCLALNMAGVTVYRGVMGYGASTLIRRSHLRPFSHEAPILVQVIDTAENVEKLLPFLDQVVDEGMIAISDVEVIKYADRSAPGKA